MTDEEFLAALERANRPARYDDEDDLIHSLCAKVAAIEEYLTAKIEAEKSYKCISFMPEQCIELAAIEPGSKRFRAVFTILNDQPATKKLMRDLADK